MSAVIDGDRLKRYEDRPEGSGDTGIAGGIDSAAAPEKADSYTVPDGIRSIEELAFSGADSLKRILLPDSVDSIGNYAFRMCYALQRIDLPDRVAHFGSGVFQHCWSLKSVKLPEGLETIGVDMFESCHALTGISLPRSLRSAARSAFTGCRSLREIDITPEQIGLLPPAARYIAVISYMEKNADAAGDQIIDGFAVERQKNLLDLAVNRRSAEAVRYMLSHDLLTESAVREYISKSAERSRIEITALLLEYSNRRRNASGSENGDGCMQAYLQDALFDDDPFL